MHSRLDARRLGPLLSLALLALAGSAMARGRNGKEILALLSWGDQISLYRPEDALVSLERWRAAFAGYRKAGVDAVLFRADNMRAVKYCNWPEPRLAWKGQPAAVLEPAQRQWVGSFELMKTTMMKQVIALAHEYGIKMYLFTSTYDLGMPLDATFYTPEDRGPNHMRHITRPVTGPFIARILEEHPEYAMVDRSQARYNWGTLEFGYPAARDFVVDYHRWFLDGWDFDGVYINFRNEFGHPEHGDQFGFGRPIVDEYRRRHGVDILTEQFDVEAWRRLRGEYLTQFVRELAALAHARKKPLVVGIGQGNYLGLPNGNLYVDWQGWVRQRLVDGLVIGDVSGKFLFPRRIGYGYLTDQEDRIGLPDLMHDLETNYAPECARHGVKLYVYPTGPPAPAEGRKGFDVPVERFLETRVDGICIPVHRAPELLERIGAAPR